MEMTIMLGKIGGSRKRGRPNRRWTGSMKETIGVSLQEVSGAAEDRTLWLSLIHRVARSQTQRHGTTTSSPQGT